MKKRNDYRVYESTNRHNVAVWHIKIGGAKGQIITTCRSIEQALEQAQQLNIDPYYFGRGDTTADRVAAYKNDYSKEK
jgi:hypothetical protein